MAKDNFEKIQGEGDRESAEEYNERTREFVESGKVDKAQPGGEAGPEDERAEETGKSRAKEVDPEVHRDYEKPTKD